VRLRIRDQDTEAFDQLSYVGEHGFFHLHATLRPIIVRKPCQFLSKFCRTPASVDARPRLARLLRMPPGVRRHRMALRGHICTDQFALPRHATRKCAGHRRAIRPTITGFELSSTSPRRETAVGAKQVRQPRRRVAAVRRAGKQSAGNFFFILRGDDRVAASRATSKWLVDTISDRRSAVHTAAVALLSCALFIPCRNTWLAVFRTQRWRLT